MTRHLTRQWHIAAASTLLAMGVAAPAQAQQTDYEATVRIMRECAKIEALEARAACYDNTIATDRLISRRDAEPARNQPQPSPQPAPPRAVAAAAAPTGFGAETLPAPRAPRPGDDQTDSDGRYSGRIARAEKMSEGIYRLTLSDGAQWQFQDAVPFTYDPPRDGSQISLRRASLGSFLMDYRDQRPVRIRRVQ
ncbi:hypothetical protein GRI97_03575 [Altererythrobacter xixiisoli]|uniref:Uncharacterized protein n=1 Tax=Croceibacterium xixiisoli TaxID=1476466 RepID=A0A6I4TU22_9SPHN|nr:hypothetical protein [Croceibacterium xixiisoli]MXO98068.1 hypothetical protein [Croceibacterium xixiisoli]